VPGRKAALAQDEYIHSEAVCRFLRDFGVETLFGVVERKDAATIYPPDLVGPLRFRTVLTGYVDSGALLRFGSPDPGARRRPIDIGYRARRPPFWLGERAQMKGRVAEVVAPRAADLGMTVDVSLREEDAFVGEGWYAFLARCRTVLGCESSVSLHDPAGRVRAAVERYVAAHPEAGFEEVRSECFAGQDHSLSVAVLSPRHLESCITRTCQVLIEGRYSGVLEPDRHYIPLRPDFGNLDDVLARVRDVEGCEAIAERAYREVAASGHWTYEVFVKGCLDELKSSGEVTPGAIPRPVARWLRVRDTLTRRLVGLRFAAADRLRRAGLRGPTARGR
jgi:hypothetical protein